MSNLTPNEGLSQDLPVKCDAVVLMYRRVVMRLCCLACNLSLCSTVAGRRMQPS